MRNLRQLRLSIVAALLLVAGAATIVGSGTGAAEATVGKQALILNSTVSGGASSMEATRATALGFAVTLVSDAQWAALTATDFAKYQLVVIGDPTCSSLPQVVGQNAQALADAVMARAGGNTKVGNRILIGTDPVFHYGQGGNKLIDAGIDFAGVQPNATGLYANFSCFDPDYDGNGIGDAHDKLLPQLTIATPNWTQNASPPCGGSVSLISNAAQFSTLTTADLDGWSCSVHESFPTFPTDWSPLAIAIDTPTSPTCGTDVDDNSPQCGEAYILIAGVGIVTESPNLKLDPLTATNPVGTTHTVTATVTNADATPRAGQAVNFVVTGSNAGASGTCAPVACTTTAAGKVTYTYTGAVVGDDTINASITVAGSTQTATAAKKWVAPTTGTKIIQGAGRYKVSSGTSFGVIVLMKKVGGGATGDLQVKNEGATQFFRSNNVPWTLSSTGNVVTFSGAGRLNGVPGYTFTAIGSDVSLNGVGDQFSIVVTKISDGSVVLTSGGLRTLNGGNLTAS